MSGIDRSESLVNAICTPAECEVWAAESSYTQAGPRAGIPVPATDQISMTLSARGTQTASSALTVQTSNGGFPSQDRGAAFIWKGTGESTYRGWDTPQAIKSFRLMVWADSGGADVLSAVTPHAITLSSGVVLVACQVRNATFVGSEEYRVEVYNRSPTTGVWSSVLVYGQPNPPGIGYHPCLVVLPSGRILCYHLMDDPVASKASIRMWYSDDSGENWSYGGEVNDTAGTIDYSAQTPTRLRGAYKDGQVVLFLSYVLVAAVAIRNRVIQYASADMGNSFEVVVTWQPTNAAGTPTSGGSFEVVPTDLGFFVAYNATTNAVGALLSDAFVSIARAEKVDVAFAANTMTGGGTGTTAISDTDLALALDDSGVLHLYARDIANGIGQMAISTDNGHSWRSPGTPVTDGKWYVGLSTADYPKSFTATWHYGRMLVLGNWVASTASTHQESIGIWELGGYNSIPWRQLSISRDTYDRGAWNIVWSPIELLENNGWTATGTGSSALLSTGGQRITCLAAQTQYYTTAPALTPATPTRFGFSAATSGGAVTTLRCSARIQWSNGVIGYCVEIRMGATGFRLYDGISGAVIGSTQTVDVSSGVEWLIDTYGDAVVCYYRLRSLSAASRLWTVGPSSTGLTDGGALTDFIRVGMQATSASNETMDIFDVFAAHTSFAGQPLTTATYPNDLTGRAYSPRWVYVHDGVSIASRGGKPTWVGDQWTISTRYDHEIRRAVDVPSPRISWRSTSTAQQVVAFRWLSSDAAPGEDSWGETDLLAIPILGANIASVAVALYDKDTTSWVSVGTATLSIGALAGSTAGMTIRPSATVASTVRPLLREGELIGATIFIDSSDSRRIRYNTEGRWTTKDPRTLRPIITFDGADGTESNTTTTAQIIPSNSVILVDLAGGAWSGVRLTFTTPGTAPAESYFEVGYMRPHWVHPIGRPHDWGRSQTLEQATELAEARDRTRVARSVAPARRTISVAWTDGIDQTEVEDVDNGVPDYQRLGDAWASTGGVAWQLGAILRRSPADALLHLDSLPVNPTSRLHVINRRDRLMLARIDGPIEISTAQGTPNSTEIVRVGQVTLSEEV